MEQNEIVLNLVENAKVALKQFESYTQEQVDELSKAIAMAIADNAEVLAKEAVEETGMGNVESKIQKNVNIGAGVWTTMKGKKSVGIIERDDEKNLTYVANPKGVIACLTPTTNPTLTIIGNAMMAVKGRNTMIVSPHPRAKNTSIHTVEIINETMRKLGAPENVVQIIKEPSLDHTNALMKACNVVVATGGAAMVTAANSSGHPSFGVGQGNVQVVIDNEYKDLDFAAETIVNSRSFDNGIICAGEQSVIVHKDSEKEMVEALVKHGAFYTADDAVIDKFRAVIFEEGHLAPGIIGKDAPTIAKMAGVEVPADTKVLVFKVKESGAAEPLCGEQLSPILVQLSYDTFEEGVAMAKDNLLYQGAGHTTVLYSNNQEKIDYASVTIPVCRLLINLPGVAATGMGMLSNLNPTSSIGCGSWGNNSISENLTYKHLINISAVAGPRKDTPLTTEEIFA